jgi:hypothetical protein
MEKQTQALIRIELVIFLFLLAFITICLYLSALNNRYMMIDNVFILDKWTKTIYMNKGEDKIRKIHGQAPKTLDTDEFLRQLRNK